MKHVKIKGEQTTYYIFPELKQTIVDDELPVGKTFIGFRFPDGKRFFIRHLRMSRNISEVHAMLMHQESMIRGDGRHFAGSLELIREEDHLFLIREFAEGMTLKQILSNHSFRSSGKTEIVLQFMLYLLKGIKKVHTENYIHCNLRPSCIYIPLTGKKIHYQNAVITDFSLAKTIRNQRFTYKLPVTYLFNAPEVILSEHELIGSQSDIYSLGIILYVMLKGHHPFRVQHPGIVGNMHLSSPIKDMRGIHPSIQKIILRATARQLFTKPESQYEHDQKRSLLSEGIKNRYPDADSMSKDIENALAELNPEQHKNPEYLNTFETAEFHHPIVMFDDMCILCTRSLKYLIRNDKRQILRYSGLSSQAEKSTGQTSADNFPGGSMILVDNQKIYTKSDAFIRIMSYLGGWHLLLTSVIIIPKFIRNVIYNVIAKNRYRWWGKRSECYVPPLYERFLFTDNNRDEKMNEER
jgi:predicted DCC family thiol-disulfide oxidoreductase YuxK